MDYDYIVVGAGSAGAVVANRLSANPHNKVLLLEAGPADHPWTRIPVGSARMITNPSCNWLYSSEPDANTNGRRIPVPRGRMLGGSSALNGMAFVRGQAQDSAFRTIDRSAAGQPQRPQQDGAGDDRGPSAATRAGRAVGVTGDVDEVKCPFHTAGHSFRKTSQFLADVFFERGSAPSTHLLDLSVGVPGQRESVGPATPERVCVDAINWDSFCRGVVQYGSRGLYCSTCILICDVGTFSSDCSTCSRTGPARPGWPIFSVKRAFACAVIGVADTWLDLRRRWPLPSGET